MELLLVIIAAATIGILLKYSLGLNKKVGSLQEELRAANEVSQMRHQQQTELLRALEDANTKTAKVISQKKSGEVRLGQIAENLAPILDGFPYNPKDCHFLGMPTDFIIFNLEGDEIVFCEIKSGDAKESPKQKKIKQLIQTGKVFYEKIQINEHGMHRKRAENVN